MTPKESIGIAGKHRSIRAYPCGLSTGELWTRHATSGSGNHALGSLVSLINASELRSTRVSRLLAGVEVIAANKAGNDGGFYGSNFSFGVMVDGPFFR